MARTRFQRADQADSDCTPGTDGNKPLLVAQTGGNEVVTALVPKNSMNVVVHSFTMAAGDPGGGEDLGAASLFRCQTDCTVLGSSLSYRLVFHALNAGCTSQGSQAQAEADFNAIGLNLATASWDPPVADRYQVQVVVNNANMSAAETITLRTNNVNAFHEIPDAPGGGPQTVEPVAIPSAEALGTLAILVGGVIISAAGAIATAESVGSPSVHLTVGPAGAIATAESLGSPTIVVGGVAIVPSGIPSGEALGSLTVQPGGVIVSAAGAIASQESVGTPEVKQTQRIEPVAIPSAESLGSLTILVGGVTVDPSGIPTAESIGALQVNQTISAAGGIPTAESLGSPTIVVGGVAIVPSGIPTAEALGSLTVQPGGVIVSAAGAIASQESVGTPEVKQTQKIEPVAIPSAESLGSLTILTGGVIVSDAGAIASAESVGTPTVIPPPQTISAAGAIPSAESIGAATIQVGGVAIVPAGIPSAESFGTPTILGAGPIPQTIIPTGIPSAEAVGLLSVVTAVLPDTIKARVLVLNGIDRVVLLTQERKVVKL